MQINGAGASLAFDAEVSVGRGGRRVYTENRVGAGVDMSDHSFMLAREFTLEGAVSGVAQLQNFARPGFNGLGALIDAGLGALEGFIGLDLSSRVQDFEARLEVIRASGDELEIVSKVIGRVRAVLLEWEATTTPETGEMAQYRLTLKEVQRAASETIANATPEALALNGSGGAIQPGGGGPSVARPGTLDVVP